MTPIYGHDAERDELLNAARGARMHHAWLLTGPQGIGKATLAHDVALRLLAGQSEMVDEESQTARLVASGAHPDHVRLQRLEKDSGELARNISIEQVRSLHRILETAPSIAPRRVILIDSADDLERNAANALLKSLEEPPANTVFLLVSHAPSRLLPTIRSRCRVLRFQRLDDAAMRSAITVARPEISGPELDEAVRAAQGIPAVALDVSGLGLDMLRSALEKIAQSGDPENTLRIELAQSLAGKAAKERYLAFLSLVPTFLNEAARNIPAHQVAPAISAWEQARDLVAAAVPLSLDPATTVFELSSQVASLARAGDRLNERA